MLQHTLLRNVLGTVVVASALAACQTASRGQTDYDAWPQLRNPFESTTGGGVMIDGYDPIVRDQGGRAVCTTDFSVTPPGKPTLQNEIVFDAVPVQGGILCTGGKWRAKNGTASGTTPFEVFVKNGVVRRSP